MPVWILCHRKWKNKELIGDWGLYFHSLLQRTISFFFIHIIDFLPRFHPKVGGGWWTDWALCCLSFCSSQDSRDGGTLFVNLCWEMGKFASIFFPFWPPMSCRCGSSKSLSWTGKQGTNSDEGNHHRLKEENGLASNFFTFFPLTLKPNNRSSFSQATWRTLLLRGIDPPFFPFDQPTATSSITVWTFYKYTQIYRLLYVGRLGKKE